MLEHTTTASGSIGGIAIETHTTGGRWTHDRSVVPSQLCQRLRHFLQPAVVGKTPVIQPVSGTEDHLNIILIHLGISHRLLTRKLTSSSQQLQ